QPALRSQYLPSQAPPTSPRHPLLAHHRRQLRILVTRSRLRGVMHSQGLPLPRLASRPPQFHPDRAIAGRRSRIAQSEHRASNASSDEPDSRDPIASSPTDLPAPTFPRPMPKPPTARADLECEPG